MKTLKLLLSICVVSSSWLAQAGQSFPDGPHAEVTPGELCNNPDSYRYPEKIPYCKRSVDTELKWAIIDNYDERFGYDIRPRRADFKIDHYIPLCMGGANSEENLWPQHKSVYEKTDQLEEKLCRLMSMGRMLQDEAVVKIKTVKNDLTMVKEITEEVDHRLGE